MEDFLVTLFCNPKFSIIVSMFAMSSYMFNILILRLRKYYYPMNTKLFIPMILIPGINLCFLVFNMIIMVVNISGYKVVKRRLTKQTYKHHQSKKKPATVKPVKVS